MKKFRKEELGEELDFINKQINDIDLELKDLHKGYNDIIKLLDNSMSLNRYKTINSELNNYTTKEAELITSKEVLDKKNEELISKKKEMIDLIAKIMDYIKINNHYIDNISKSFQNIIEEIYDEKEYKNAYINITGNNGDKNQVAYNIDVHVSAQNSDGVTGISIFAFDLLLLRKKRNHKIDFIFHDSRLFESIDPRQIKEMFIILNKEIKNNDNFQYICSLNEDKLKSLKDLCGDDNFYYDLIQKHIKLKLTDTNKLLGEKIDFNYN
jgi:uncharacterized protein YydD (DUF2326 family)